MFCPVAEESIIEETFGVAMARLEGFVPSHCPMDVIRDEKIGDGTYQQCQMYLLFMRDISQLIIIKTEA